jgi:hypothetical protein
MASGGSTVVGLLHHHPKVKGLSPVACTFNILQSSYGLSYDDRHE